MDERIQHLPPWLRWTLVPVASFGGAMVRTALCWEIIKFVGGGYGWIRGLLAYSYLYPLSTILAMWMAPKWKRQTGFLFASYYAFCGLSNIWIEMVYMHHHPWWLSRVVGTNVMPPVAIVMVVLGVTSSYVFAYLEKSESGGRRMKPTGEQQAGQERER